MPFGNNFLKIFTVAIDVNIASKYHLRQKQEQKNKRNEALTSFLKLCVQYVYFRQNLAISERNLVEILLFAKEEIA